MIPLRTDIHKWKYRAMIGVGGIGYGVFFSLNQNHTLGREESRSGHFLDQEDYCKLHIVSHYVKTLLGTKFDVFPIGKVGEDEMGKQLILKMNKIGIETRFVEKCKQAHTLYSFCFNYPDGTGGNLTTDNSACNHVNAEFVSLAEPEFHRFSNAGIALAVPEVPIDARRKLLEIATAHHFYRVASFASDEIKSAIEMGLFKIIDLLAINLDEASKAVDIPLNFDQSKDTLETAVRQLILLNPKMHLVLTGGKKGSWYWDGESVKHQASFNATVNNTAGAGDAYLASIIVGLVAGLSISKSHELGALVAAFSVESVDTIAGNIDRNTLLKFINRNKIQISDEIRSMIE